MQKLRYKLLGWDKISEKLLDEVSINAKNQVKNIFKENILQNITSNKSDNVNSKWILNITIFRKYHHVFYAFS